MKFHLGNAMSSPLPNLLAFDFDGVICDGLVEYFQTAWRAYCDLYDVLPAISRQSPPPDLAERFYRLRPVIETGWEMPIMIRAMETGIPDEVILAQWPAMAAPLLTGFTPAQAARVVDSVRDAWIQTDQADWLGQHRFYPGLLTQLKTATAAMPTYIISTKEGRFIQQLLQQQGLDLPAEFILGKEVKRPKYETLRLLRDQYSTGQATAPQIWFVEDQLQALQTVQQQPDLNTVTLFLADWGYNLDTERQLARETTGIHVLSLDRVVQEFPQWLG